MKEGEKNHVGTRKGPNYEAHLEKLTFIFKYYFQSGNCRRITQLLRNQN